MSIIFRAMKGGAAIVVAAALLLVLPAAALQSSLIEALEAADSPTAGFR